TQTVDLLASTPTVLGDASAVTGTYGSAQIELPAPTAATDPQGHLGGQSVALAGSAVHADGTTVRFRAAVTLSRPIEGIAFEAEIGEEPGRVRCTVQLANWLDRVDFSRLSAPDAEGISSFEPTTQPMN